MELKSIIIAYFRESIEEYTTSTTLTLYQIASFFDKLMFRLHEASNFSILIYY
jgi:hypothetical protein